MINPLVLDLGQNAHGQWVVRDPTTGSRALLDLRGRGMVVKPGTQPTDALLLRFAWVLTQASQSDACTEREGCAPFKA